MKIYIPVLTKYARHGGVTQFLSNFIFAVNQSDGRHQIYDHSGEIIKDFSVSTFGGVRSLIRKFLLYMYIGLFTLKLRRFDHVFLNPSLGKSSMMREMYYARRCISSNKKFSIFIHGWSWDFSKHLDSNISLQKYYSNIINSASSIFVLGEKFKEKLIDWGVDRDRIHLEKTTVNDDFIPDVSSLKSGSGGLSVLFLARIVRAKGIFEAVDAFAIHVKNSVESKFTIAGDGDDLDLLKDYVHERRIPNISFVGFADESMKRQLLADHDVFLFPTLYPEGMPICIFEAMAYGLTVITRPVGGVPDYFQNGKMGYLLDSVDPAVFADALNEISNDGSIRSNVSVFNNNYVKENASSTVVGERIISRFREAHGV